MKRKPEDLPVEERVAMMVQALSEIAQMLDPVLDAVAGYKAKCEARGFPSGVVEAMVVQYHGVLMGAVGSGASQ